MYKFPDQIVFATHNRGKLVELQRILGNLPTEWLTLNDLDISQDVIENGGSFAENAAIKAVEYAKITGMWTLADDSGLTVDALDGRPGIYSARYGGGHDVSFPEKWTVLLDELKSTPWTRRTAQFRCVLVLSSPNGKEIHQAEGICPGRIAFAPRGSGGFGYDPLFYLDEFGCTLAELGDAEKDNISHRGLAARALLREIDLL